MDAQLFSGVRNGCDRFFRHQKKRYWVVLMQENPITQTNNSVKSSIRNEVGFIILRNEQPHKAHWQEIRQELQIHEMPSPIKQHMKNAAGCI